MAIKWSHPNAPGYLQAIASVLALAVAIYVGYSQDETARAVVRNERELQGKSLEAGIRYELIDLRRRYDFAAHLWKDGSNKIETKFTVPELLLSSWDKLYLLGDDAGPKVQQALADSMRLSADLENTRMDVDRLLDGTAVHPNAIIPTPTNKEDAQSKAVFVNSNDIEKDIEDLNNSLTLAEAALKIIH